MSTPGIDPADAVDRQEQELPVVDEPDAPEGELEDDTPEADAAEQRVEVPLDEEDAPIG